MAGKAVRVVIAAGGTAGHLSPGIAVAGILRSEGAQVLFIGRRRGLEQAIVEKEGFRFRGIAIRGRGPRLISFRNARAAVLLTAAVARSASILKGFNPHVVVGAGGYVSLAPLLAASVLRLPVVVHEQNAVPGLANRVAGRFAARVAVSFPGTEAAFGPRAVLTGNPVRREILEMDKAASRKSAWEHFGLDRGKRTLLVFGGSQGALHINRSAAGAYDQWRNLPLQVLHLAGRGKADELERSIDATRTAGDSLGWRIFEYSDRMDLAYAAADLAVCRAGASTIAELASAGVPAVLVPLPISLDDDQRRNAEAACRQGGARMLLQKDLSSETLAHVVSGLLFDDDELRRMSLAIRSLARPDAAEKLAELVREAARPD